MDKERITLPGTPGKTAADPVPDFLRQESQLMSQAPAALADTPDLRPASDYIKDFGDLGGLSDRVTLALTSRGFIKEAEAFRGHLHDTCVSYAVQEPGNLDERAERLHALQTRLATAREFPNDVIRVIDAEVGREARIIKMAQTSQHEPRHAIERLFGAFSALWARPSQDVAPLTGSLRAWRERELRNAFNRLDVLSGEIRDRAGNSTWEVIRGRECVTELKQASTTVKQLVKEAGKSLDANAVRERMARVEDRLGTASTLIKDSRLKAQLQKLADDLKKLAQTIIDALFRRLAPAAAPMRPSAPA